jgi:hypothetical protein
LTNTKTANHISLDGLICWLTFEKKLFVFKKVSDFADIARLRRLKEIAENNKDHERALAFHADEMRAKRWHENISFRGLFVDYIFDWFSDYGRSASRPLICLTWLWIFFGCLYFFASGNDLIEKWKKFWEALAFSGGQIFPIIPGSSTARMEGIQILFFNNLSPVLHLATFVQSVLSLMLLFLIGLALRNRFRI